MMYIHQDSGLLNASYFKFDVDDKKGNNFFTAQYINNKNNKLFC